MSSRMRAFTAGAIGLALVISVFVSAADPAKTKAPEQSKDVELPCDCLVPNSKLKAAFKDEVPITYVTGSPLTPEWNKLSAFWNEVTETVPDPITGDMVTRKAVKIKVPLGLNQAPPVPFENPMTVAKWVLGKELFFDTILSSDGTVSCASCHDPKTGWTTPTRVSTGIRAQLGGMNGPTVLNSAYNQFQFWDGRATTLEDQSQGPVQNPVEMYDGDGHPWDKCIQRVRKSAAYAKRFENVFGHAPTRDAVAKAVASYERTVLIGNSINDRADIAMKKRVLDEDGTKFVVEAKDYETVLKEAITKKDANALAALNIDPAKDAGRVKELAGRINNGRVLFLNKARCNGCHVGDNFTDHGFHNLGVGVKDSKVPVEHMGRFAALPTGHKDPQRVGAFKTPGLRGLLSTAPYMHDGSEPTLEKVIDFYDKGGVANEFLDIRMRDEAAEKAYLIAQVKGTSYKGPAVQLFGAEKKPIVSLPLKLTDTEKQDLVLFMRSLQGDPVDPLVADREKMPGK